MFKTQKSLENQGFFKKSFQHRGSFAAVEKIFLTFDKNGNNFCPYFSTENRQPFDAAFFNNQRKNVERYVKNKNDLLEFQHVNI